MSPTTDARGRAPRPGRAARASVPGGPDSSVPPAESGGKTSPRPSRERAAAGMPGPDTGGADPGVSPVSPVRARAKTPAGASGLDSPPAGSRGLRGAEWQAAVKKAQRRQSGRGAPRAAAKVTIPPVTGGAALTAVATCLGRCDWTAGPGDPAEVDKSAEKHTKAGLGHPTNTVSGVTA